MSGLLAEALDEVLYYRLNTGILELEIRPYWRISEADEKARTSAET